MPKTKKISNATSKFSIYAPKTIGIEESFKSQIVQPNKNWVKKDMGEEHPFDYKICDAAYSKFGIAKAAVDIHLNFMFSRGFSISSDNPKAELLIKEFIKDKNAILKFRQWTREALVKGSGFMEIAVDQANKDVDMKVIGANSMFIKRDDSGEIQTFKQYTGDLNRIDTKKFIDFKPDQIAYLPLDQIGDAAYGIGLIMPGLYIIDNLLKSEKDMHLLMGRKANSPIIATIGSPEEPASQTDVSNFGQQLIYLNNLHEWAVSHTVKFDTLDFGNLSDKFNNLLEHDKETLFYTFQTPPVLMGSAYQNEGIADVQLDTFERRIQSIQSQIEEIIQDQIFKVILEMNGLDADVNIEWKQTSEASVNDRVDRLTRILALMNLTPEMRSLVEKETAELLGFEETEVDSIPDQEEMAQRADDAQRAKEEQNVKQPKIPGEKPATKPAETMQTTEPDTVPMAIRNRWKYKEHEAKVEESLSVYEFINFHELRGFNYGDYLSYILDAVQTDTFDNLRAKTEEDYNKGLLTAEQITRLRSVFEQGFSDNLTIAQIEKRIKTLNLPPVTDGDTLIVSAEARPNLIARTETVRLANQGLVDLYTDNGVEKVSWLTSISNRTCDECEALDGEIFEIGNLTVGINQPPLHPNCRCSLLSVTE